MDKVFTLDSFAEGAAGSAGGISAITVFYPLNYIRTVLQSDDINKEARSVTEVVNERLKEEGISGLYQGWWGQIVALGCSNFIYFYTYQLIKAAIQKNTQRRITPGVNLAVGAVAGVVNVLSTTPLWMIFQQLTTQRRKAAKAKQAQVETTEATGERKPFTGVWDGLTRVYQEEGLGGLWKGLGPNLLLVSNPTIHYFVYFYVRRIFEKIAAKRGTPINALEFFCMGALAKLIATFMTYPLQYAQSQLRNDRPDVNGNRKYQGTVDCLKKVYQRSGWPGLYRGVTVKSWQTVLTAAFQLMTYEKLRVLVFYALTGKKLLEIVKEK